MQRPGDQLLALDQRFESEVRQMTTTDLRHERDRLRELIASAPPSVAHRITLATQRCHQAEAHLHDPETAPSSSRSRLLRRSATTARSTRGFSEEQTRQAADRAAADLIQLRRQQQKRATFLECHALDATRYLAVVQELAWRHRAQAHALEIEQPSYLLNALGPPSQASRNARVWRSAATQIESYRRAYAIAEPYDALGPEPKGEPARHKAWRACYEAVERCWDNARQERSPTRPPRQEVERDTA